MKTHNTSTSLIEDLYFVSINLGPASQKRSQTPTTWSICSTLSCKQMFKPDINTRMTSRSRKQPLAIHWNVIVAFRIPNDMMKNYYAPYLHLKAVLDCTSSGSCNLQYPANMSMFANIFANSCHEESHRYMTGGAYAPSSSYLGPFYSTLRLVRPALVHAITTGNPYGEVAALMIEALIISTGSVLMTSFCLEGILLTGKYMGTSSDNSNECS